MVEDEFENVLLKYLENYHVFVGWLFREGTPTLFSNSFS
jgi:hypothetical protein